MRFSITVLLNKKSVMTLELISRLPKNSTDKPPLLFLHGMGFGAWCWDEHFLPWFAAKGYPSYAMSLRGHGNSSPVKNLRWERMESYRDDLAQIYEGFDQPPIIIGHSMGGYVVQKFLAEYPFNQPSKKPKPPAIILLSSTPSNGLLSVSLRTMLNFPRQALSATFKGSARPFLEGADIFQKTMLSKTMPLASIERYSAMTGDESMSAFITMTFSSSPKRHDNPPPMLVIGAQDDAFISPTETKNTALYYKADYTNLEDLAHLVMLDTNWENAAQEITQWLAQQSFNTTTHKK